MWVKVVPVTWVNSGHKPLLKPLLGNVLNLSAELLKTDEIDRRMNAGLPVISA